MSDFTDYYKNNINNISNWYPKIKDCGIKTPKTFIIQVPENIMAAFFMDHGDDDLDTIFKWVKENIMPVLSENNLFFFFMKNGTFSNKFDFNNSCRCRANVYEITTQLVNLCYNAELLGAGGISEIAIREFIGVWYNLAKDIPTIYNGMLLRPEFRVFYNFDKRKVLYTVNYWDWQYCHDSICSQNATDKIVYESYYDHIAQAFESNKQYVEDLVAKCMNNVNLTGIWSVDIMLDEQNSEYWLIDMAIAQQSAYWNGEENVGND